LEPLLARRKISFDNWSCENLIETIVHSSSLLKTSKYSHPSPVLGSASHVQLSNWLQTKLPLVEAGFLHFEPLNPEFSQRVSRAYDILLTNQLGKA
jgi:hypothetical protein